MEKIKRRVINWAQKPSQQMSGTAGQGAQGPPTAPSPGTAARRLLRDPYVQMILGLAWCWGSMEPPPCCSVTDDHFSPIILKLKDPQT